MIDDIHLDILFVTETYLNNCILNNSEIIDTKKFTIFRCDRNRHGGVLKIVGNEVSIIHCSDLDVFDKFLSFLLASVLSTSII